MNKLPRAFRAAGFLFLAPAVFAQDDDAPALPESYAEVRLSVEGMT